MELTKEDYKKIEDLIKITEVIDNLYNKLYELEKNNQKETIEYNKTIKYLKMTIEEEQKIYQTLNIDIPKVIQIICYLSKDLLQPIDISNPLLNKFNYDNRVFERITETLLKYSTTNISELTPIMEDVIKALHLPNISLSTIKQELSNTIQIDSSINIDYKRLILILLKCTNDINLLQAKYNFIFTNKDIEQELINSNLSIGEKMASDLSNQTLFLDIKKNTISTINDLRLFTLLLPQILYLLDLNDEEFNNENQVKIQIVSIIIRSLLSLSTEEQVTELNYQFHNIIEDKEYIETHPNNTKSEQLIITCFKQIKKDKTRIATLKY